MDGEPLTGYGTVKFWKAEKGWGAIVLDGTDLDIWGHFGAIEMSGYRTLEAGRRVFVEYEMVNQDSFRARALRIVPQEIDGSTASSTSVEQE